MSLRDDRTEAHLDREDYLAEQEERWLAEQAESAYYAALDRMDREIEERHDEPLATDPRCFGRDDFPGIVREPGERRWAS